MYEYDIADMEGWLHAPAVDDRGGDSKVSEAEEDDEDAEDADRGPTMFCCWSVSPGSLGILCFLEEDISDCWGDGADEG